MPQHLVEQRRLVHRGSRFHFVSYDRQPANAGRGLPEVPAMWYLMGPGKRWAVMPYVPGQPSEQLDAQLLGWLGLRHRSEGHRATQ